MNIIKNILKGIATFLMDLIVSFLGIVMFCNALNKFHIITLNQAVIFSLIIPVIFAGIKLIFNFFTKKNTKIKNWIFLRKPKLLLAYCISLCFLASIKNELMWGKEDVKSVINIQWTIFAVSITIFLFWHVWFTGYIKSIELESPKNASLIEVYDHLQRKKTINKNLDDTYSAIIYLIINVFTLLLSTTIVYINGWGQSIGGQIVILFSMYLCTNTLGALFIDVVYPIMEAKAIFSAKHKYSKEDELSEKLIVEKISHVSKEIEVLLEDESIYNNEKRKKLMEIAKPLIEKNDK